MARPEDIKVNVILESTHFPERVRVLQVQPMGDNSLFITAVGVKTTTSYELVFPLKDLEQFKVITPAVCDFTGSAERFFLAVEATRIRYSQQFDPLLAVHVSQVDPLPHQIEAVYFYLLRHHKVRFLLADDPGAGKTIMTGLLLKELKYRGLVRRVMIVVPGHLREQWIREMHERFGENFQVVDRAVINGNWGRNIWSEHPQVITSMDFAKQREVLDALVEVDWDLVVVDEAHKLAAYQYGSKTKKTDRYQLGELLSRRSQHMLFLTATPHRGDPQNFRLLLDLLEPGLFANIELLRESVAQGDNPLFLRRLKEDLKSFEGKPLFPPRHAHTRTYHLNDDEKHLYNAVTKYVQNTYNLALAKDKRNVAFASLILQRRLASSVRAVRRSLERRTKRLQELLELGKWMEEPHDIDEEELEDAPDRERYSLEEELVERLTLAETREELEREIQTLQELIRLAREAERHEVETKLMQLRDVIQSEHLRETQQKLLIFTESRDTMEYLSEKLKQWGYSVTCLHGGMRLDERIQSEHEFRHSTQVMVSTEAGGEGINLQFCSLMVNYDIPWNPNRLEQRLGRIHRYGQQREVHMYNLVTTDTYEGCVLATLLRKIDEIRRALGSDRVFDVIGDCLSGRSLKDLIVEAIMQQRHMDEILAEIEAIPDKEAIRRVHEASLEGLATRHINLHWVLGEERKAREERLVPEYIQQFFERACRNFKIEVQRRADGLLRVPSVPHFLRNISTTFKYTYGQVGREYNKLAFDRETALRKEAEFIAPGHALLESLIDHILHEAGEDLKRGAVFEDPEGRLDGWLWFVEGEVRDGEQTPVDKRLFTVYQPADWGELCQKHCAILWDLKPSKVTTANAAPPNEAILQFVIQHLMDPHRKEVLARRQHEADIIRKYGLRSLQQLIMDCEVKLLQYEERRIEGVPIPNMEVENVRQRKETYLSRQQELEVQIARMTSVSTTLPRILGVVRVVPQVDGLSPQPGIEQVGMEVSMAYERRQGRDPEDVSAQNLGYDILSRAPDGSVRYIEVKARAAEGKIELTPNEWFKAQRLGDEYWLYIVAQAATTPQLYLVQNPASKLRSREVTEIVRFEVVDWKESAEPAE